MMYEEYSDLRAAAEDSVRADGGFVDPVKMRQVESLPRSRDWRIAVLGYPGYRDLLDIHTLLIAHERNLEPPLPAWLVEQRAAEAAREDARRAVEAARVAALQGEWNTLRAAFTDQYGADLLVAYNYSGPHHYAAYTSGADHIILTADLTAGRVVRRAGLALCSTPSARRHQSFDHPHADGWPTCRTCLRTLCRLTGQPEPAALMRGKSR